LVEEPSIAAILANRIGEDDRRDDVI
jgi:hypothetical protein